MKYVYSVLGEGGKEIIDNIEASSQQEAEEKLKSMGLDIVDVSPYQDYDTSETTVEVQQRKFSRATSDKGKGFLGGVGIGWLVGFWLILIGVILCFTGIGAILGIPLIIGGILMPILGAAMGLSRIKGACPYCGSTVGALKKSPGVNCPGCKKRLVIRDGGFLGVD